MQAGFAGRITLTIPLATLLGLADRPAEIGGIGPVDPALARDLARAATANPATTWCVTVTDQDGHAIGHGCARSESQSHRKERAKRRKPGPPDGRDPPRGTSGTSGPEFSFMASGLCRTRDSTPTCLSQRPPHVKAAPGSTHIARLRAGCWCPAGA